MKLLLLACLVLFGTLASVNGLLNYDAIHVGILPKRLITPAGFYDGDNSIVIAAGEDGSTGQYSSDVYKLDLTTGEVQKVGEFPTGRHGGEFGFDSNGTFYYMGGYKDPSGSVIRNDLITAFYPSDTYANPVDIERFEIDPGFSALASDTNTDTIYIHAPETLFIGSTMFAYDTKTGVTSLLFNPPYERAIACSVWYEGSMYLFGGTDRGTTYNSIFKFTPSNGNEFVQVGELPYPYTLGKAVLVGSKAYLIGGANSAEFIPLLIVDMETLETEEATIGNLPGDSFMSGNVAYVPHLGRIYHYGGYMQGEQEDIEPYDGIFYVQL